VSSLKSKNSATTVNKSLLGDKKEAENFPYRLVPAQFSRGRIRFKKKSLRFDGGVIGVDRILNALGKNGFGLFRDAWMIPPLFSSSPIGPAVAIAIPNMRDRHQMKVKLLSGFSAPFALSRCSIMTAAFPSNKDEKLFDLDVGTLQYEGLMDIEVVVKIDYEFNVSLAKVRKVFADIVHDSFSYCLQHSQHDWKLHRVTIPSQKFDSSSSDPSYTNLEQNSIVFNAHEFSEPEHRQRLFGLPLC